MIRRARHAPHAHAHAHRQPKFKRCRWALRTIAAPPHAATRPASAAPPHKRRARATATMRHVREEVERHVTPRAPR
eukprot:7265254-Prymnesium_polylepis.3